MTTAQDQQSRELLPCPFCGSPNVTLEHIQSSAYEAFCEFCGASGPCDSEQWRASKGWNARALPARGVDPMLDIPASMKPVAEIFAGDLFRVSQGPDAEPVTGDHYLYTAAQVQAMLAHRGHGEGANQPQTRMDAGAGPGRGLPPADGQVDCIGLALELESQAKRVESQSVERAMAAAAQALRSLATNKPPAPTTGAGSATAGAAPAYRLLQRNVDTIQADDEFLRDADSDWQIDPQGIFVGMTYMSNVLLPARRAIENGT